MSRRAFTLIELLVVLAIIATLAALLIPAIGYARNLARASVTGQRCDDIQRSLAQLADGQVGAADRLHELLAPDGLGGVYRFKRDYRWGELYPDRKASDPVGRNDWLPLTYEPWCFAFPWGRVPTDLTDDAPTAFPDMATPVPVEVHALSELTPLWTVPILRITRTIETADPVTTYRTQRRNAQPWNDGWGRPLVVALGMYHPRKNTALAVAERESAGGGANTFVRIRQDLFFKRAKQEYGFAKAVYVSVGAIGNAPRAPLTDASLADAAADWDTPGTGQLAELWRQVNRIANAEPPGSTTELWTSEGGRNPFQERPWTGVRRVKHEGRYALIAAPQEIR